MIGTDRTDTIFAPSSAVGGAIAVIRVSGPQARRTRELFSRDFTEEPGKLMYARALRDGETVDDCMAVWFPAPKTYTGEDMAEINCHGGPQTVRSILELLGSLGFRPAEGGEFTRRAFLNGKMDLSQAEAVMDLINADAERSRRAAIGQLHGQVSRLVHGAERNLIDALAGIDAAIDYPDEAEEDAYADLPVLLDRAGETLETLLKDARKGRVLRDGLKVCILGLPNVGKSSILNALVGEDRAIVTSTAGTTRDTIDARVSIEGIPVRLIDTAGIREASDEAERIGIDRAKQAMEQADLLLVVLDASTERSEEDLRLVSFLQEKQGILLLNKCDLNPDAEYPGALRTSAKTGEGLEEVRGQIADMTVPAESDAGLITNERHIHLLEKALESVRTARGEKELDCAATDLKDALHALGGITGSDVDADVIDRIFERFCVGK